MTRFEKFFLFERFIKVRHDIIYQTCFKSVIHQMHLKILQIDRSVE